MSEPEKYTLPRVLEIVKRHAVALKAAAEGLQATEGKDPDMLAFVGECALKASEALWDIDGWLSGRWAIWSEGRVYDCLFAVPALVLAVRAATTEPDAPMRAGKPWAFCQYQAETLAEDLMAWVTAHEKDAGIPSGNFPEGPEEPQEPTKPESEELMPMEAFDAMAGSLRPLVSGLADFETGWPCELTPEGVHRMDEMASIAAREALRLSEVERTTIHTYLPTWCGHELYNVTTTVERVAWILFGASEAVDVDSPPERPQWAAVHGYDMVRAAYQELCANQEAYMAADRVGIDKQWEDKGYIKQPNGDWHPTPEMLKEMEAGQ